jgi:hypothetical protein
VQTWTKPYFLESILEISDRFVAGGPTTRILAERYGALLLIRNFIILANYVNNVFLLIAPLISK